MKENNDFNFRQRGNSFKYAFAGIFSFFKAEHNAIIHLAATTGVIILAAVYPVTTLEIVGLTLAIGFVWVAELINTAVERIMDFISQEKKSEIKIIKDLAAAAVLVAAMAAVVTGAVIFIPKIF